MVKPVVNEMIEERLEDRSAQAGNSPSAGVRQASDSVAPEVLRGQLESQPALMAWKQLLSQGWKVVAIDRLTPRKQKSCPVFRLRGPQGETVIAKRCRKEGARIERMIYQEVLPRVPLPRLEFRGLLEEPVGEFCWLFLEDAASEPYSPKLRHHRALAGRWLGEVQVASFSFNLQDRLPGREPGHYFRSLRGSKVILVDHLGHNTAMVTEDAEVFHKAVALLETAETHWSQIEETCGVMPRTLVHGDFAAKNVLVRDGSPSPALLVFDWEFAGWGVPGIDLAQLDERAVSPDLDVYGSVLQRAQLHLTSGEIQAVAACGNLFRLVEEVRWATSFLKFDSREYLIKTVEELRFYEPLLAKALEILKVGLA